MRGGLQKLPRDRRDLQFGAVFTLPQLEELPKEFSIGETEILDQGETDYCSGYATCAASAFQEEITLHPVWSFAVSKILSGDIYGWGQNLRDAVKVHQKYGAIPLNSFEMSFDPKYRDRNNFPNELFVIAEKHKKQSYFSISGNFDSIRQTLWANRTEERAVITGCLWRIGWLNKLNGIIPKFILEKDGFGHAFIITGWKEIDGESYLIAQLSNGKEIGNKGKFYFPKIVVNREFTYGCFVFKDMPLEEAKQKGWSYSIKILNLFKKWFEEFLK